MFNFPVIVGFGGINSAGRSSFHHSFHRLIFDDLHEQESQKTIVNLASLMGFISYKNGQWEDSDGTILVEKQIYHQFKDTVLKNTLIRKIHPETFHTEKVLLYKKYSVKASEKHPNSFIISNDNIPPLQDNWEIKKLDEEHSIISIKEDFEFSLPLDRNFPVKVAGQLPLGYNIEKLYPSFRHPRTLQLAITASSEAIQSLGIEWEDICKKVRPDEIGVYASSSKGQIDKWGVLGYAQAPYQGKKPTSKQMPFSFADMPADFVNAYVLGNMGTTMSCVGACATFLYNLKIAVSDIMMKKTRVAIVGCAEAPLSPEIMEAYHVMNALADEQKLRNLDNLRNEDEINYQHASRPFGKNCGFVLSESAQFIVLFDDELVLETGANIYGSVGEVFTNSDGFKSSIAQPGIGNYITLAKACATAKKLLSGKDVTHHSFIHAHGSSTPQNRVTESLVFEKIAQGFKIENWPICAVKCYLGHPTGPASGDQLVAALGSWHCHTLPGIITTKNLAPDVHTKNLDFVLNHRKFEKSAFSISFINSKGFGGNNATGFVMSPSATRKLLQKKFFQKDITAYKNKLEKTLLQQKTIEEKFIRRELAPLYQFGKNIIDENTIKITPQSLTIPGKKPIWFE